MALDDLSNLSMNTRLGLCGHRRVVDDVLDSEGVKTKKLICKECGAVFPDDEEATEL